MGEACGPGGCGPLSELRPPIPAMRAAQQLAGWIWSQAAQDSASELLLQACSQFGGACYPHSSLSPALSSLIWGRGRHPSPAPSSLVTHAPGVPMAKPLKRGGLMEGAWHARLGLPEDEVSRLYSGGAAVRS